MQKRWILNAVVVSLIAVASAGAQVSTLPQNGAKSEPEKRAYYRLVFNVREVEDQKVINSREYTATQSSGPGKRARIRSNSKVPYATSDNAYQFFDLGVNIDCLDLQETNGAVSISVQIEISNAVAAAPGAPPVTAKIPVIRQFIWGGDVVLPLRKPTIIYSSDDPSSKRQMQIELTVTPVK